MTQNSLDKITSFVKTQQDAEEVVAHLLENFASSSARNRIRNEAYFQKQSSGRVVRRTVTNLMRGFSLRRNQ